MSQNEFYSGKFENLEVDNKMSHTCGNLDPQTAPKVYYLGV